MASCSHRDPRPGSSMSTFSSATPTTPAPATQATPTKRSRSLQRGGGGARHARSVSSEGGGGAQLCHSTPQVSSCHVSPRVTARVSQDLDGAGRVSRCGPVKTWRSSDGLVTPVSPSPAQSPARQAPRPPGLGSRPPAPRRRGSSLASSVTSLHLGLASPRHRAPGQLVMLVY